MHNHDHDHDGQAVPHTHLTSVGIDIGSSTSHLMFSRLQVGYPSLHRNRPEILERRVIGRSPVLLTPFSKGWKIEVEPLKRLVDSTFEAVGLHPEEVDTGAVIITGEAARRENAGQIAELFSDGSGRFVCATAGARLEAILAAHGSGAMLRSREEGSALLNVDVGGGTTKVSLIARGKIQAVTAFNLGARLLAFDERGRITRMEKAGSRLVQDLGWKVDVGHRVRTEQLERLAARMASILFDMLQGKEPPWKELSLMPPLMRDPTVAGLLFSGGVSEYIYRREKSSFGDLGPLLGREIRAQAQKRGYPVLDTDQGIRATVIGASQYSMQLSGETIFIPDPKALPLRNLRVLVTRASWDAPVKDRARKAVEETLAAGGPEVLGAPFALAFHTPPFVGYAAAQELASGVSQALVKIRVEERPKMLVFEQNIGRVVGGMLAPEIKIACVDEVSVGELDFVDVGQLIDGEEYVPVVIKSLAFGA